MRRKDKQVLDPLRIKEIIEASPYVVAGLVDGGASYQVPLDFGFDGEVVYFHCAQEGRKLDILRKNPEVSLLFVEYGGVFSPGNNPTACSCSTRYGSVMAWGRAEIVEDPEAKLHGVKTLLAKSGKENLPIEPGMLESICVVAVRPRELSGKQSPARR